jgi:superfamily II DNA/RNA helicase
MADKSCNHATTHSKKPRNLSRRLRWTGRVARMGEKGGAYRVLVGKPEGRNH